MTNTEFISILGITLNVLIIITTSSMARFAQGWASESKYKLESRLIVGRINRIEGWLDYLFYKFIQVMFIALAIISFLIILYILKMLWVNY